MAEAAVLCGSHSSSPFKAYHWRLAVLATWRNGSAGGGKNAYDVCWSLHFAA